MQFTIYNFVTCKSVANLQPKLQKSVAKNQKRCIKDQIMLQKNDHPIAS